MGFLSNSGGLQTSWTVGELTTYIKELFEIDFRLQDIDVEGEISNFTLARSGHLYFTLKDKTAQIKCVMWRSTAQRLSFAPEEGDAVVIHGRISVYEAGGVYQLYADKMIPVGRGGLAIAFEQLKERLAAEGLFDQMHKKVPSLFPRKIGIVTSVDAAALRDILNVLNRRCPVMSVLIASTLVQGDQAPAQIKRALQWLDDRTDIETIILARGGGSIEDLWAFNDEGVARAIFHAQHPIICGVGHETDFTIADFVADVRAPTPSAAAELAVPDLSAVPIQLEEIRQRMAAQIQGNIHQYQKEVQSLAQSLALLSPRGTLDNNRQRIDNILYKLERLINEKLDQLQAELAIASARLTATSPLATLSRGYAIVRTEDGHILRRTDQIDIGERLDIQVSNGQVGAVVESLKSE
ncbi:MAG: exodeoxyribonuclease VII large subunit [Candidatus Promineifilaceae bacterium]|nr:exodeoxyribonuclease VII large subunit [Candidatus Promineifilaceae bacterium]